MIYKLKKSTSVPAIWGEKKKSYIHIYTPVYIKYEAFNGLNNKSLVRK